MKKAIKTRIICFLLVCISLINFTGAKSYDTKENTISNSDSQSNTLNLVTDIDVTRVDKLPSHFRTTADLSILGVKHLNLKGLKNLNISGSEQFSEQNLPLLLNAIRSPYKIIDIDLRQESHGFINGIPVSWKNENDNANEGLTLAQINNRENVLLNSLKKGENITFTNIPDYTVEVKSVSTEEDLVKEKDVDYMRIPVTDYELPTNDTVDCFLSYIKNQPKKTWLHFHCKQGVGRTTTFMIMYDIIKNCNDVPLDDIILRQVNFPDSFKPETQEKFLEGKSYEFFKSFYKYCKDNGKDNNPSWSSWIKLQE